MMNELQVIWYELMEWWWNGFNNGINEICLEEWWSGIIINRLLQESIEDSKEHEKKIQGAWELIENAIDSSI